MKEKIFVICSFIFSVISVIILLWIIGLYGFHATMIGIYMGFNELFYNNFSVYLLPIIAMMALIICLKTVKSQWRDLKDIAKKSP